VATGRDEGGFSRHPNGIERLSSASGRKLAPVLETEILRWSDKPERAPAVAALSVVVTLAATNRTEIVEPG
jgi:hypothetical protein